MRKRLLYILLLLPVFAEAQSFEEQYRAFRQAVQKEYSDFREQANAEYADFLRAAWAYYRVSPAIPRPKDEPVPPVPYDDKQEQQNQEIKGEVVPQPEPTPTPQPVAPIKENDGASRTVNLTYYGTPFSFRVPKEKTVSLPNIEAETLAAAWEELASDAYYNLLQDCLSARDRYKLCDWAYLSLLQQLAEALYGKSNAAVLLQAFIYANSGYQMRLAVTENGRLHMLIGSKYVFYDRGYYEIGGEKFFPLSEMTGEAAICNGAFENEKPLSLLIANEQHFASSLKPMPKRKAQSGLTATCSINQNLIDFYNTYPTGQYGDDFGTRWAAYANSPMDETIRKELYPQLMAAIRGVPEAQAVNLLLNWVQTAFEYEYDDKVWGGDRAFFPAESLHYPYCDCEDRSILFSRIIRDLLNLDVVLLYYPGHLATAVAFHQDIRGDYLTIDGRKFIVCDPTYIGAPVGATMPDMDNQTAKVICLNN